MDDNTQRLDNVGRCSHGNLTSSSSSSSASSAAQKRKRRQRKPFARLGVKQRNANRRERDRAERVRTAFALLNRRLLDSCCAEGWPSANCRDTSGTDSLAKDLRRCGASFPVADAAPHEAEPRRLSDVGTGPDDSVLEYGDSWHGDGTVEDADAENVCWSQITILNSACTYINRLQQLLDTCPVAARHCLPTGETSTCAAELQSVSSPLMPSTCSQSSDSNNSDYDQLPTGCPVTSKPPPVRPTTLTGGHPLSAQGRGEHQQRSHVSSAVLPGGDGASTPGQPSPSPNTTGAAITDHNADSSSKAVADRVTAASATEEEAGPGDHDSHSTAMSAVGRDKSGKSGTSITALAISKPDVDETKAVRPELLSPSCESAAIVLLSLRNGGHLYSASSDSGLSSGTSCFDTTTTHSSTLTMYNVQPAQASTIDPKAKNFPGRKTTSPAGCPSRKRTPRAKTRCRGSQPPASATPAKHAEILNPSDDLLNAQRFPPSWRGATPDLPILSPWQSSRPEHLPGQAVGAGYINDRSHYYHDYRHLDHTYAPALGNGMPYLLSTSAGPACYFALPDTPPYPPANTLAWSPHLTAMVPMYGHTTPMPGPSAPGMVPPQ